MISADETGDESGQEVGPERQEKGAKKREIETARDPERQEEGAKMRGTVRNRDHRPEGAKMRGTVRDRDHRTEGAKMRGTVAIEITQKKLKFNGPASCPSPPTSRIEATAFARRLYTQRLYTQIAIATVKLTPSIK